MKKVITYQVFVLIVLAWVWAQGPLGNIPAWLAEYKLAIDCMIIAALGGALYCVRGIYTNYCVDKNWDSYWEVWYYLRPIASSLSGLIAYIFLKAGIVILEADPSEDAGNYGYLAFAFVAGFNVDKFLRKIEDIAKSSFGIEKSRASKKSEDGD